VQDSNLRRNHPSDLQTDDSNALTCTDTDPLVPRVGGV